MRLYDIVDVLVQLDLRQVPLDLQAFGVRLQLVVVVRDEDDRTGLPCEVPKVREDAYGCCVVGGVVGDDLVDGVDEDGFHLLFRDELL